MGSNPIGSTQKYADLQVKCERSVEARELIRGLVLQPILQRVLKGAVRTLLHSMLLRGGSGKITAEQFAEAFADLSVQQAALMAVYLSLR